MAQVVKNLSAMRETAVPSPGRGDPWRREQQPTPVLSPEETHGQRSLVVCSARDREELDMTERLSLSLPSPEKGRHIGGDTRTPFGIRIV